jgi:hypothetical protein
MCELRHQPGAGGRLLSAHIVAIESGSRLTRSDDALKFHRLARQSNRKEANSGV